MIKSINVENLYGLYSYQIDFKKTSKVTILTGPNGYGKTTILKIIHNLLTCNLWYFNILVFSKIRIVFEDECSIVISKLLASDKDDIHNFETQTVCFKFCQVNESKTVSNESIFTLSANYLMRTARHSSVGYRTMDMMKGLDIEDYLTRNYRFEDDSALPEDSKTMTSYLLSYNNLYVKEQRIQYEVLDVQRYGRHLINRYNVDKIVDDIKRLFAEYQDKYVKKCQEIDSHFVEKLLRNDSVELNEERYNEIALQIKQILDFYHEYGIAEDLKVDYTYNENFKVALFLYLQGIYDKLRVYHLLFLKMMMFVKMIDNKMLSKKTIKLNAKDGLRILDDTNYEVPLRKLSSGEQNLIILYFYLIFKTYKGTIVCLDEPENSMHVAWQKSMLEDFKNIAKEFEIQLIFASHSIDFVNDDWDDCVDLYRSLKNHE